MRKAGLLILVCLFVFGTVQVSFAASNYVSGKLGVFIPGGDLEDDLEGDNGFNGEIAVGHRYTDNLAVEVGFGYYGTENSWTEYDPFAPSDFAKVDVSVYVLPLTVSIKGILPVDRFNLYAGAGIGAYFGHADVEIEGCVSSICVSEDDDEWATAFGGQFMAGFEYNLNDQMFVGVEGKYILTGDAEFDFGLDEVETNLNGGAVTATIGYRF